MDEFHQHVLECLVPAFVKSIGLHQEVNTILNRWLYAVALSSAVLVSQYHVYVHSALPVDGMGFRFIPISPSRELQLIVEFTSLVRDNHLGQTHPHQDLYQEE